MPVCRLDQKTVSRTAKRNSRDPGSTLTEILIAVVLVGVVAVPAMETVRVSVQASSTARSAAQVETAIVNAADRINRAPLSCDYDQYAKAAVQTQGWEADRASVTQVWYDPYGETWVDNGFGCRFAAPTDDLIQLVTIEVTSPDGRVTRTIQVVKSHV